MKFSCADKAWIPRDKLKKYLLSPDHPTGNAKARFFCQLGYRCENMEELEWRLLELGRKGVIVEKVVT